LTLDAVGLNVSADLLLYVLLECCPEWLPPVNGGSLGKDAVYSAAVLELERLKLLK
jgi:hypothetical protein